jgi:hypothetical protein
MQQTMGVVIKTERPSGPTKYHDDDITEGAPTNLTFLPFLHFIFHKTTSILLRAGLFILSLIPFYIRSTVSLLMQ